MKTSVKKILFSYASGGELRQTDKPFKRINDIHVMVDFLQSHPYWKPEYVSQISTKLTDFFGKNL
ncbi:hypothetical protein [Necropsobacter rosorum]|uniref:hypothetical protein n=1 Tax=Necropsobacter rosorum TaxID=908285 RepID=UPI0005094B2A